MKISSLILFIIFSLSVNAQDVPVKWATQETFFEDLVGKPLPAFEGKTIDGEKFSSRQLKAQVVVINFWFENCPPCLAEMPELNKLVEKYGKDGVRFIGITHDLPGRAKRFQKQVPYRYQVVSLSRQEIAMLNINHGFPSNILIGKDGRILSAMANISFSNHEFSEKSLVFESKLVAEIQDVGVAGQN
ncbi:redoxin domain-containing protein [Pedobacter petrophilus]|uniref:Redoxin domain-containing protein n=1 Tax=Pedobacter petrophilus TaxID=1908241 RepID=A0A7K0FWN9_9SPHI|nr:TlpA disulfide reductase family protein [Pedobacter petrophilus]MRX75389.1 redoxin domain-containing protein [Pedobacter petrophilus]